jgi:hypothetical protein
MRRCCEGSSFSTGGEMGAVDDGGGAEPLAADPFGEGIRNGVSFFEGSGDEPRGSDGNDSRVFDEEGGGDGDPDAGDPDEDAAPALDAGTAFRSSLPLSGLEAGGPATRGAGFGSGLR